MSDTRTEIRRFLDRHPLPTPCLVIDVDAVRQRFRELATAFGAAGGARVYFAVKACPEPAVLSALIAEGAHFDVASPGEIDLCLSRGAPATSLSYGNPIKKASAIARAHAAGVREFVCDAESDLDHIAQHAPGAEVSVRLLVDAPDSVTPFGSKFGCEPEVAARLLSKAGELGLDPAGLSFHVGSQQLDVKAWDLAIATAAKVAAAAGGTVRRLNLGGGYAIPYREPAPALTKYAEQAAVSLRSHFGDATPELLIEPGRAVVADAGLIRTEVVLVTRRRAADPRRWVYLDIGRYNGLAEAENEAIAYRVERAGGDRGEPEGPVVLAGPTCDGDDVLYQDTPYQLPLSLQPGDQLDIPGTGAYTASYSSVAFNGIEPLRTYCVSGGRLI
ncbi:type III PLP-dependent enzyme [Amycolatopsis marina]|uniref:type III PLP-dependent enzyme n=1 Tax=Amycolatopsis marina TaxID=490629 RepID=UPI000B832F3E|nr:type III PLP-dependent enzyme [Amycolatopsis marina]